PARSAAGAGRAGLASAPGDLPAGRNRRAAGPPRLAEVVDDPARDPTGGPALSVRCGRCWRVLSGPGDLSAGDAALSQSEPEPRAPAAEAVGLLGRPVGQPVPGSRRRGGPAAEPGPAARPR